MARRMYGVATLGCGYVASHGPVCGNGRGANFKSREIEAAIPGVLNLARATGTDLAQSADIAAGTLRAFALEAGVVSISEEVLFRRRVIDIIVIPNGAPICCCGEPTEPPTESCCPGLPTTLVVKNARDDSTIVTLTYTDALPHVLTNPPGWQAEYEGGHIEFYCLYVDGKWE